MLLFSRSRAWGSTVSQASQGILTPAIGTLDLVLSPHFISRESEAQRERDLPTQLVSGNSPLSLNPPVFVYHLWSKSKSRQHVRSSRQGTQAQAIVSEAAHHCLSDRS